MWEARTWGYLETTRPSWYDILINWTDKYLNFNTVSGTSWYGFRDNAGVMEFKNTSGAWTPFSSWWAWPVTTIGTIDSVTPSANWLVISWVNLYAQSASATRPGMVNLTTQTFTGIKTFGDWLVAVPDTATAYAITVNPATITTGRGISIENANLLEAGGNLLYLHSNSINNSAGFIAHMYNSNTGSDGNVLYLQQGGSWANLFAEKTGEGINVGIDSTVGSSSYSIALDVASDTSSNSTTTGINVATSTNNVGAITYGIKITSVNNAGWSAYALSSSAGDWVLGNWIFDHSYASWLTSVTMQHTYLDSWFATASDILIQAQRVGSVARTAGSTKMFDISVATNVADTSLHTYYGTYAENVSGGSSGKTAHYIGTWRTYAIYASSWDIYSATNTATSLAYRDANKLLKSVTLGSWVSLSAGGTLSATGTWGTVTSVGTGTGLTGWPISTTGTISLSTALQPMATLAGNSLKALRVNAGETAVEYYTPTTGTVTSIATAGLISWGTITTTGTITTSMNTGRMVGRSTAWTGVMEEITVGSGLSLVTGTLSVTSSPSTTLTNTYVWYGDGSNLLTGDANFTWSSSQQSLAIIASAVKPTLQIVGTNQTTSFGIYAASHDAITTWGIGKFVSNSTDNSNRSLIYIENTSPLSVGTYALNVVQKSTNYAWLFQKETDGTNLFVYTTVTSNNQSTGIQISMQQTSTGNTDAIDILAFPWWVSAVAKAMNVKTGRDHLIYSKSGNITFVDYAPTIAWLKTSAGSGDNMDIHATDWVTTGNGGSLYLYGGLGAGVGQRGNTYLWYTSWGVSVGKVYVNGAYTLPTVDGTAWYIMSTDGAGTVSWIVNSVGTVTSVSGTANRISSTGGATPVIDIDSAYVWQTSITTLGTIATGVRQGTVVDSTYGGTGINNGGRTLTISTNSGTLAFSNASKTLTIANSITLSGTDATTMTFPTTSATIARTDAGQTFTGVNVFTSPDITTSITTSSTSFTAWTGATTLLTIGGTGASASLFAPSTLDTTSATTGAIRTSWWVSSAKAMFAGTTITATTGVLISANDWGALGASWTAFSDLFLATGWVINWAAGNATLTHSTGALAFNAVPLTVPVIANWASTSTSVTFDSTYYGKIFFWSPSGTATATLPANGATAGSWFTVVILTNQTVTISAATADTLQTVGDLTADSVAFSTASQKIGACVHFVSDGTRRCAMNQSVGCTMTIAT